MFMYAMEEVIPNKAIAVRLKVRMTPSIKILIRKRKRFILRLKTQSDHILLR